MKKSIFIAVLGLAAGVASSYGQGFVAFNSYSANGLGATTSFFNGGALLPAGYTAELFYAIGTVADPVDMNSAASITSAPTGLTLLAGSASGYASSGASAGFPGYFDGGVMTIPGYSSGAVTFEIWAFGPNEQGRSGAFTMTGIAASTSVPVSFFGDNGAPMPNFVVAPVPEPTTLALAGLGGLASLVALRRKQA
jgi:PEP-CTERM motif